MKRFITFLLLGSLLGSSLSSVAQHQRLIVVGGSPFFPFDPISDHYRKGSLAVADGYIKAWAQDIEPENVYVAIGPTFWNYMPEGYKAYCEVVDSTLPSRVAIHLGVRPFEQELFKYELPSQDTIKNGYILVVDRYQVDSSIEIKQKIVDINDFPISKEYMDKFNNDIQAMKRFFATPVAHLDTALTVKDCFFGPSMMAGLFHSFQLKAAGSDLSLFSPPRSEFVLDSGELYAGKIYELLRYDNALVVVKASGAMVKEYLEEVYANRFYVMRNPQSDLVRIRTPYYMHESAAGCSFTVNLTKSKGKRIEQSSLLANKMYSVAMSSFRARWFVEHGCQQQNIGQYRILFLDYLHKNGIPTNLKQVEQWKLIPERWAAEASKREQEQEQ
ncbi:MAG: 5'-nucleotidase [Mucinivorans sp.]